MNGFINILKPKGMSSAYAVGGVKKKLKVPCGHMGTLDPMAEGVLPVGVSKASRLFDFVLDKEKEYVAEFKFGVLTDTLDITGNVLETSDVIPSIDEIKDAIKNFVGEIEQIPPKYSAKCVDGKRGYELARKGIDFTLEAKKVTVLAFELLEQTSVDTFRFRINCKGGTYIRSLARDLGYSLNTFATMTSLVRTKSGIFDYQNGVSYDEFMKCDNVERYLIASDLAINYPKLVLSSERAKKLLDGVYENYGFSDGTYRVYCGSEFWGVGIVFDGILKMKAYVR